MKEHKESISRVCELLQITEEVLRTNADLPMAYTRFKHPDELANEIQKHRDKIAKSDFSTVEELSGIFAPTSEWDDCVGESGSELANEIYQLLEDITRIRNQADKSTPI